MSVEYLVGDVFERLATLPDASVDLVVTSPPFLALRSYLPADHPDKRHEIGSERTPADFLDTLLALTAELGRVLTPHGSLCVELGDTYAGGNATGTDQQGSTRYPTGRGMHADAMPNKVGAGWPLPKSLTGIPTLYAWSLAYGRNLLTGQPSPAGQWRIRNVIVWARPNPPVGQLADKFRPATSYITVACRGRSRYFDLDAVRDDTERTETPQRAEPKSIAGRLDGASGFGADRTYHADGGAPPLDWHADDHPADGDWLWRLAARPYRGAHYAAFPMALPLRLIDAMCPLRVCTVCGRPSERLVEPTEEYRDALGYSIRDDKNGRDTSAARNRPGELTHRRRNITTGWSDCGHDAWRAGRVLDPFAGTGTTLEAAQAIGRHAVGIDLDARNADLARDRVGMFLTIDDQQQEETA